jgi:glycosyltransferase involved in cell wall biosynthesis
MKVSVFVVTYNHQDFIEDCLNSVLAQEVDFEYEIVVGEDCSTDKTRHKLFALQEKYRDKIRLVLHERNVGASKNYRAVLSNCGGVYIAHLDGDDLMRPGKLQKQADFLDENPDFAIVCHNVRIFESGTNKTLSYFNRRFKKPVTELEDLVRYGTYFCNSSKMYRRSALSPDDIDLTTNYVVDWLTHIKTARCGKIGYLDEVLGEYRVHGGGTTSMSPGKSELLLNDQLYTLRIAESYGVSQEALELGWANLYCGRAVTYLKARMFPEFREHINTSFKHHRYSGFKHLLLYKLRHFPHVLYRLYRLNQKKKQLGL